jgi:type I restriction enzyme S subunit
MSVDLLLRVFDRATDAPDAILRLRRFVLDLAVRGKLTERSSDDEPASSLLSRIQSQLEGTLSGNSRRKSVHFAPITASEAPFSVPEGWIWARVRQITRDRGQIVPTSSFTYIDVTAIDKELGRLGAPAILSETEAPSRARKIVSQGDVLYSCVRPYLLNIAVIEEDLDPLPIASTAFAVLDGFGLVEPRYLWTVLRSPYFVECVEDKMRGQAYPAINDSDFSQLPVPLPPLAEQGRIVAIVDELMALCDQLEIAQKERESQRDTLRNVALHRLTATSDDAGRITDVRFFLESSPRLITTPEHVVEIRKTVLDLAVRGRLVPKDARSCDSEVDSKATLGDAVESLRYGTSAKCSYERTDYPVLRIPNVVDGRISLDDLKYGHLTSEEAGKLRLIQGDILVVRSNGSLRLVGRPALVDARASGCYYAGYLVRARPKSHSVVPRYLVLSLQSPQIRNQIEGPIRSTVGLKNINTTELMRLEFRLPSLSEQHRIVAKVDELMAVCDQLEGALASAQFERGRLLESLLHEALSESTTSMDSADPSRVPIGTISSLH